MASPTSTPALFLGQEVFGTTTAPALGTGPSYQGRAYNVFKYTLTSAQILALETTAVTILPAPGVGYWIAPTRILINMAAGTVAYADGGGGAVSFAVGSQTAALAANTVFLAAAGDTAHQIFDFAATAAAGAPATDENAALTISKATANFTAGNGIASIVVEFTIQATI
jgi:hypothetical protein